MGLTSLAPFTVGVLGPFLVEDFDLSHSQVGSIVSAAFGVAALVGLSVGGLVDRLGARRVLVGALLSVAAGLATMAAAPVYAALLAGAALGGVGVAAANPTTNKVVAVHVAAARQGLALGIKQSGVQLGAFAAAAVLPPIALGLGWRAAVAVAAATMLAGVALTFAAVPRDRTAAHEPRAATRAAVPAALRWLVLYGFLMGSGIGVVQAYLPLYAHEHAALDEASAGVLLSVVSLTAVPFGIAYARASRRFSAVATPLMLIAALATAPALGLLAAAPGRPWPLWLAAVGLGATAVAWNATGMLAVVSGVGARSAGRASGAVVVGFYAGFVAAPIAFGAAVDASATYAYGWAGVAAVFAVAALAARVGKRRSAAAPGRGRDGDGRAGADAGVSVAKLDVPEPVRRASRASGVGGQQARADVRHDVRRVVDSRAGEAVGQDLHGRAERGERLGDRRVDAAVDHPRDAEVIGVDAHSPLRAPRSERDVLETHEPVERVLDGDHRLEARERALDRDLPAFVRRVHASILRARP
jgi:MFS family permease